jgi:hypothetical protein
VQGDGVTDSGQGRWRRVKGLDRGRERRRRGSGEDSMMARSLQRGLNDDTEAPGRTRRWRGLWGGRQRRGIEGNFQWEILVAWWHE